MKKFADMVLKYRVGIIVGTIAITLFMGYQTTTLKINSDILNYIVFFLLDVGITYDLL